MLIAVYFITDVEAELTQKYGQGETYLTKCETCNYEQIIQTAGVHVLTGGVIKVYSDDDEFVRPNCVCDVRNTDDILESKSCFCSNLSVSQNNVIYH